MHSTDIKARITVIHDKEYMTDAKGNYVPVETVKPIDKLQDDVIDKIIGYAAPLSEEIARFRQHCFDDVDSFVALAAEKYGAKFGGKKGNVSLISYDGCRKVDVAVADLTTYTAEILAAEALVNECLRDWSAESRPEIRAVVERAFKVDKSGRFNRAELTSLLRLDIDDERWQRAMQAIRDAEKIVGSKRYVRMYRRDTPTDKWQPVSLDIASV